MALGFALAKDCHEGGLLGGKLRLSSRTNLERGGRGRRLGGMGLVPHRRAHLEPARLRGGQARRALPVIRRDPHVPHPRRAKIPAPTIAPTPRKTAPQTVICFGADELAVVVAAPVRVERSPSGGSDISLGYTTARESGSLMLEAARWAAAARRPTLPGLPSRRSGSCPFDRAESG
jgi:hypothetical protein